MGKTKLYSSYDQRYTKDKFSRSNYFVRNMKSIKEIILKLIEL